MSKKIIALILSIFMIFEFSGYTLAVMVSDQSSNQQLELQPVDENNGLDSSEVNKIDFDQPIDINAVLSVEEIDSLKINKIEESYEDWPISLSSSYDENGNINVNANIDINKLPEYDSLRLFMYIPGEKTPLYDSIISETEIEIGNVLPDTEYTVFFTINNEKTSISYNGKLTVAVKESLVCSYSFQKEISASMDRIHDTVQKVSSLLEKSNFLKSKISDIEKTDLAVNDIERSLLAIDPEPQEREPNNTMQTANTIYDDVSMFGRLNPSGDVDYYQVQFSSSGNANFWLGDIPAGKDYDLYLYDGNGTLIARGTDPNTTDPQEKIFNIPVVANARYYLQVVGYLGASSSTGWYCIRAKNYVTQVDDHGDSFASATFINIRAGTNANMIGTINYGGDNDYFRFVAPTSGTYSIISTSTIDTYGYLYNSLGNLLVENDDGNGSGNFKIVFSLTAGQTYYIRIRAYSSTTTGGYVISIAPPSSGSSGDGFATATTVFTDQTFVANIRYGGDNNYFKFVAPRTGSYTIVSLGDLVDTYGYLYDSSGLLLSENDDGNGSGNFKITYHLTANQTYYLRVRAYSVSATGTYILLITSPQIVDDHGDTIATATNIQVDTNVNGNIDFGGDNDYFKFTAPKTGGYTIATTSSMDTYGYLYNSSGTLLSENDDGNGSFNFKITHTLTENQVYYVRVRAYSSTVTGSYVLKVTSPDDWYMVNSGENEIYIKTTNLNEATVIAPSGNKSKYVYEYGQWRVSTDTPVLPRSISYPESFSYVEDNVKIISSDEKVIEEYSTTTATIVPLLDTIINIQEKVLLLKDQVILNMGYDSSIMSSSDHDNVSLGITIAVVDSIFGSSNIIKSLILFIAGRTEASLQNDYYYISAKAQTEFTLYVMATISIYGATMAATVLSAMGYTVVSGCVRYTYTTVEGVAMFVEVAIGIAEALLLLGILIVAGIAIVAISQNAITNFHTTISKLHNALLASVSGSLERIGRKYGNFECDKAANAMKEYLKKHNLHGWVVTIQYPPYPGYVLSIMYNDRVISENGMHMGILYDGKVYCNVHPYGLSKNIWLNDFDGLGNRTVTEIPF